MRWRICVCNGNLDGCQFLELKGSDDLVVKLLVTLLEQF